MKSEQLPNGWDERMEKKLVSMLWKASVRSGDVFLEVLTSALIKVSLQLTKWRMAGCSEVKRVLWAEGTTLARAWRQWRGWCDREQKSIWMMSEWVNKWFEMSRWHWGALTAFEKENNIVRQMNIAMSCCRSRKYQKTDKPVTSRIFPIRSNLTSFIINFLMRIFPHENRCKLLLSCSLLYFQHLLDVQYTGSIQSMRMLNEWAHGWINVWSLRKPRTMTARTETEVPMRVFMQY